MIRRRTPVLSGQESLEHLVQTVAELGGLVAVLQRINHRFDGCQIRLILAQIVHILGEGGNGELFPGQTVVRHLAQDGLDQSTLTLRNGKRIVKKDDRLPWQFQLRKGPGLLYFHGRVAHLALKRSVLVRPLQIQNRLLTGDGGPGRAVEGRQGGQAEPQAAQQRHKERCHAYFFCLFHSSLSFYSKTFTWSRPSGPM